MGGLLKLGLKMCELDLLEYIGLHISEGLDSIDHAIRASAKFVYNLEVAHFISDLLTGCAEACAACREVSHLSGICS